MTITTAVTQRTITLNYTHPDGTAEPPKTFEEFIPEDEVYARISEVSSLVGRLIDENPGEVIVSPIMSGATQTMDEMLASASHQYPEIDPEIKPVKLKRYHGTSADKQLTVEQDLPDDGSVKGKIVIFFDEVVDAGIAAEHAIRRARSLGAARVIFVTLTDKPEAHHHNIENLADHFLVGFSVPNVFLLGWGMDWFGMGRWLRWIGRLSDGSEATYTKPLLPTVEELLA